MWINAKENLPVLSEETKVMALLRQDNSGFGGSPISFHDRVIKVWWLPQKSCFAFSGIENANHLITHWFEIPRNPEIADA